MKNIEPTSAELEMIRLKREQDENQSQQDLLKSQLEYDDLLKRQQLSINQQLENLETNNKRIKSFYDILIFNGCIDIVNIVENNIVIKCVGYIEADIKPEDVISEIFTKLRIHTKWGDITEVRGDMKAELPSSISTRFQSYKAISVATKLKDKISEEITSSIKDIKKNEYKKGLLGYLKEESPVGTVFSESKESAHSYGSNRNGNYSYRDFITLKYPNGSWVKIYWFVEGWFIESKFDSKLVKPAETKEEWLKYLSK